MRLTFFPKTKIGKVSVSSFAIFIVTWTLVIVLNPLLMSNSNVLSGEGQPSLTDMLLIFLTITGMIAVFVGLVTGLLALFKKKDRSVLLIITTLLCVLIGLLMILFLSEGLIV